MKIDTTIKRSPAGQTKEAKSAALSGRGPLRPGTASRMVGNSVSDEVRLTGTSGRMHQLEAELAELDVEDAGKIGAVRQAIADGSFAVDEGAVADGLIQEAIDNIAHHPKQ